METETDPRQPHRRRRSDNVGWGSIPKLINTTRRAADADRKREPSEGDQTCRCALKHCIHRP